MLKILGYLIVFITIPFLSLGQANYKPTKEEETTRYSQAIAEYIKAIYKRDKSSYDTLYFGRNNEFPDITLPSKIENTGIVLLTQEEANERRKTRKSLVFINMVGWLEKDNSEFIFITFYPGYEHQYDCTTHFSYDTKFKKSTLKDLDFKNYAYK